MKKIYVLRHGQADSLGKNYDQLTELGFLQSRRFAEYVFQLGIHFNWIACGSLQRQIQTTESFLTHLHQLKGLENKDNGKLDFHILPELNEFEGALWKKMAEKVSKEDPEFESLLKKYRELKSQSNPNLRSYFGKIIQRILKEWIQGYHDDIHRFIDYHDRVISSFGLVPEDAEFVLFVTSATPVAIFAGYALGLDQVQYLPLMENIPNSSLSIYEWDKQSLKLICFNCLPHLWNLEEISYI